MLIKKHNKVILFSNNIEKLFSFIVLMQVVLDTFLMCCLGFIIIISLYNDSSFFVIVKMMLASIAVIIETFIICYVGEYLSVKSKTIVDAACNSLWYEMRPNDGKIILLIILRSQRQLTLTAGNMMDLSLDAFANNESIADAAYDSLWYDMPSNYGKIITFIIMRSQSQLKITAGKFMDLSLEAFANILKASASYISVFNAIY
ncbi:odorant receptor 4-like [Linepithema humile]|uniref:odorant receptor 4-like n=1 Tax=Linepithema humile TaxID=83485 RepID=UPI00351EAB35